MNGRWIWFLVKKRKKAKFKPIKKIISIITSLALDSRGCYIGSGAEFKDRPRLPHGLTGILISSGAKIGKKCTIYHQVTIGSNSLGDSKGAGSPTIGDNCLIGAGAKIIGDVIVGNNVRIGANAVVVKDVPDNAVVVNQPSRIIQKDNLSNNFKRYVE